MKTLYINQQTGDFEMDDKNRFKTVEGDDAIRQGIWVNLTTNLGEYFLNRDMGLDRFAILGKTYNEEITIQEVTDAILQHDLVAGVEEVKAEKKGRKLYISYVATKLDESTLEGVAVL